MGEYISWGIYSSATDLQYPTPYWDEDIIDKITHNTSLLTVGNGRSYGDVCINTDGACISTKKYNRFIRFDREQGIIECNSGVNLADIHAITISEGWFIPVTPGTKNVTVGGMVANDVHGKNHHVAGSLGNHIIDISLLRSDLGIVKCSASTNSELFAATIGGLGLTGFIQSVTVKLKKIHSPFLFVENIPFRSFSEFEQITKESDADWEYTVSWINGMGLGADVVRGVFSRGKHIDNTTTHFKLKNASTVRVPITAPNWLLNRFSMKAFNLSYGFAHRSKSEAICDYNKYFYPLDRMENWNNLYGKRGFFQYQCVIPVESGASIISGMLRIANERKLPPYLSVLKLFGGIPTVGIMSFPMAGYTIAMDFPNLGQKTLSLFDEFDRLALSVNGRVYPAKDARITSESFQRMYPQVATFKRYIDPKFSSDFWRRVNGQY